MYINLCGCGGIVLCRKNTCPECRSKTIQSKVIRLYANVADPSYIDADSNPQDLVGLQNENDNLKYQLIEKDGAIKSKTETITRLQDDNKKLNTNQSQSKSIIITLEQKLETNKMITLQNTEQVCVCVCASWVCCGITNNKNLFYCIYLQIRHLKTRLQEIDQLKDKLKEATNKNRLTEIVHQMINGTQHETEDLLREHRTPLELATTVTTLKRELLNSQTKRSEIRHLNEELSKQIRSFQDEKALVSIPSNDYISSREVSIIF